jgi:hypothetical protein
LGRTPRRRRGRRPQRWRRTCRGSSWDRCYDF